MPEEPVRIDSRSWTGEIDAQPPRKPPSRLMLGLVGGSLFLFSNWQVINALRTGYVELRHGDVGFHEDPGLFSAMLLFWALFALVTGWLLARPVWRCMRRAAG